VVLETAGILHGWLGERHREAALDGSALEAELSSWGEEQAWRGPCALWLDSVRRTWNLSRSGGPRLAAENLIREMSLWLEDDERDARGDGREPAPSSPNARTVAAERPPWTGEPLVPGRRLPSRRELGRRAAKRLGRGECILVTAWSETVAVALESVWRAGLHPEILIGEGSPDLDGRRMARRLAHAGLRVTMVYDSAVLGLVPRVDRVWLGTESVGAGVFLARTGTRLLIEECARRDVPVQVLATSDKLVPGGALRLPSWCEEEDWRLWEDPPEGVRLESQTYESVPIDLLDHAGGFLTEMGPETPAALHLRALRVDAAPPCGAGAERARASTT